MTLLKPATLFLSFCVFLAGCTPAAHWAEESHARLAPGMSTTDVQEEIGDPAQIVRGDAGQMQTWKYTFESHAGTGTTILLIIILLPLLVLAILGKGGGSISFGGGGGSEPTAEFTVDFDGQGRVVGISPIRIVPR